MAGIETKPADRSSGGAEPVLVTATPAGVMAHHRFGDALLLVIGREQADISIPDESVSRRHAEVRAAPLAIRDLGSTNGTRVQGQRVGDEWVPLAIGSVVELGDAVMLVRAADAIEAIGAAPIVPARRDARAPAPQLGASVVAASPVMQRLGSLVELVGPSKISVLVLGETGAGKEVIARALHQASPRRDARLLALNCAAIATSLLEAELFGFEKGAFTGATQSKQGLFESAHGGTVFLDEIGELPLETQAKLLRVLESGEVLRVGALAPITVDVRFISATHRDLQALVERGQFRLDLLFRLSGVTLAVPPLRERREDIEPLARRFLAAQRPDGPVELAPAALAALAAHPWPGNVRELKSTIERADLLSRGGIIEPAHLAFGVGIALGGPPASAPTSEPLRDKLESTERDAIVAALTEHGGNQSRAAKALGISRATLIRRLEAFGITRPRGS